MSEQRRRESPTREEWAKQRRTRYYDLFEGLHYSVSRDLKDYPTQQEMDAVVAALKLLWRDKGRKVRAARQAAGPLLAQPGEGRHDFEGASRDRRTEIGAVRPAEGGVMTDTDRANWMPRAI